MDRFQHSPVDTTTRGIRLARRWAQISRDLLSLPLTLLIVPVSLPNRRRVHAEYKMMVEATGQTPVKHPYWATQRAAARLLVDLLWLTLAPKTATKQFSDHLEPALDKARSMQAPGQIFTLLHHGSIVLGAPLLKANGVRLLFVMAKNKGFFKGRFGYLLRNLARNFGQDYLEVDFKSTSGGSSSVFKAALMRGQSIAIAPDYYNKRRSKGVEVQLAGKQRRIGTSIARLALETGSEIVPVTILQKGSKRIPVFGEPIDPTPFMEFEREEGVRRLMQGVAKGIDPLISSGTPQWHLIGDNLMGFGVDAWARVLHIPRSGTSRTPRSSPPATDVVTRTPIPQPLINDATTHQTDATRNASIAD